jgi:hypothetical protein
MDAIVSLDSFMSRGEEGDEGSAALDYDGEMYCCTVLGI